MTIYEVKLYLVCNKKMDRYFLAEERLTLFSGGGSKTYKSGLISTTIEGAYNSFMSGEGVQGRNIVSYSHCEIFDVSKAKNADEAKKLMLVQKLSR
jgi:hypothetical protein